MESISKAMWDLLGVDAIIRKGLANHTSLIDITYRYLNVPAVEFVSLGNNKRTLRFLIFILMVESRGSSMVIQLVTITMLECQGTRSSMLLPPSTVANDLWSSLKFTPQTSCILFKVDMLKR